MNIQDKNLFYIGGIVRDEILGQKSFDIDLTYQGDGINFAKNIPNAKILKINESFGTAKIEIDGAEIDIASTRSEIYPKAGHLPVIKKIGCSLKEDILRRDFTINALAKSTLTGEIIDYTNGLIDIKNKKIKVLHDKSFIEDPSRIVRALKFSVRFGFDLEEKTQKLQTDYLKNINYDMSYKRLKKELIETFNLNKFNAFEKFINQNIYKLIAPQNFKLPNYNFEHIINKYKPKNIWIIYVGLLDNIENLPLTKIENRIVNEFRKIKNKKLKTDFEIYKAFCSIPLESIIMYSTIDYKCVEKYLENLSKIKLHITGNDLKNLGYKPGEKYLKCFDYILEKKISNPKLTKEQEIEFAKIFFKKIH